MDPATSFNPPVVTTSASVPFPTTPKQSSPTSTKSVSDKMCVTPSSSSRKSRFSFHSDTKAPKEFNNLVDSSHVRQTEYFSRLNDTDRRVAAWISRQTEELLDRQLERSSLLHEALNDPLERCVERVMNRLDSKLNKFYAGEPEIGWDDTSTSDKNNIETEIEEEKEESIYSKYDEDDLDNDSFSLSNIDSTESESKPDITRPSTSTRVLIPSSSHIKSMSSISNDISNLSRNLYQFINITIPSEMKDLQALRHTLIYDIPPKFSIEQTKVNKREGKLVRKFETISGVAAKSFLEENASRVAQLQLVETKVNERNSNEKLMRFQREIANIRQEIEKEKANRIRQNEIVLEKVINTRDRLQKLVLESLGTQ